MVTAAGTVTADQVVIATHYPFLDRGLYFARLEATRAYCIAARLRSGSPPRSMAISAGNLAWSTTASGDLLILAGQSHTAGQHEVGTQPYDRLADFARQHWDVEQITHQWSAQDPSAFDHLPMIGTYRPGTDRLYVATGFQKWGLSTSAFAATILADLITGQTNPWADRFSPHRLSLRATPTLARLNATVAAHFIGDRLHPPDTATTDDIPTGEAKVVKDHHGKTGVYRDDDRRPARASPLRCTHLGCLLRFNGAETQLGLPLPRLPLRRRRHRPRRPRHPTPTPTPTTRKSPVIPRPVTAGSVPTPVACEHQSAQAPFMADPGEPSSNPPPPARATTSLPGETRCLPRQGQMPIHKRTRSPMKRHRP